MRDHIFKFALPVMNRIQKEPEMRKVLENAKWWGDWKFLVNLLITYKIFLNQQF